MIMPRSTRKPPPAARRATQPAETFRRSRRDRAAETAQDYVEAIADLSAALGEVRVVDLSRRDRASETAQDYVEAIADLTAAVGEARVVDLARRLGVTHVTVNRTLARLQKIGFVNTKPYRAIFLTEA